MKEKTILSRLTKLIVALLILLLCAISFFGIHKRDLNGWKNVLPDFVLGKELGEARTFNFEVSTETEDVETEESTEESVEAEAVDAAEVTTDETKEVADANEPTTVKVPVNNPDDLNLKTYKKSKRIIENRLRTFGINDEIVSLDESNGSISMVVPSTQISDFVVNLIETVGKVEIVDSDTDEVLLNNDHIKKVETGYNESRTSTALASADEKKIDIGITLILNSKGLDKLNDISKKYIETTDETGEKVQKTITVKIDGETKYRTYFDPSGSYSSLFIPLYNEVEVNDVKQFNQNYNDCLVVQSAINGGVLPLKYKVISGTQMSSTYGENFLRNAIIVIAVIIGACGLYVILKYGKDGIMICIIELGFLALFALLLRAASVTITFIGLITILLTAFLNFYLAVGLREKEKVEEFAKFLLKILPLIITLIVFVFAGNVDAKSMGMIGFWSLLGYVYTFLVSLILLKNNEKEGAKKHE